MGSVRDPNLGYPELFYPHQGTESIQIKGMNFWGTKQTKFGICGEFCGGGGQWEGILGSVKSQKRLEGSDPRCEFQELEPQALQKERFDFSVPILPIPNHPWEVGCSWKSRAWSSPGLKPGDPKTLTRHQMWDLIPKWILDPITSQG